APMVAGVAALMVSLNPGISAIDLRALLLQHALRSSLPVAAGYADALDSALAVTTAVGYDSTQPPRLQILNATADAKRTQLQVAVVGSTQAIKRYQVRLDNKNVAALTARRATFTVSLARRGRRARIDAVDASGRRLATVKRKVTRLRAGKRLVNRGHGVGT
ncbi:MAG TPA: hypothetical protein VI300_11755, partial [Solirubrobacter sp.]